MARNNIEFELKPKEVEVFSLKLISYKDYILKLEVECGSGTYIRALSRDIAYKTNSLATMTSLIRTKIDNYNVENCLDIQNINTENIKDYIAKINDVLGYKKIILNEV